MNLISKEQILKLTAHALRIRRQAGYSLYEPLSLFNFVEDQGVEVQFQNIASMEGIYCSNPGPIILINSERPLGRQAFTCAHELGHHTLGHGTKVDELINDEGSFWSHKKEFEASCFGAALLMPKIAVEHAFAIRGWKPNSPSHLQLFTIASYLGVSYGGLINHMHNMLGLLSSAQAEEFWDIQPLQIREEIMGERSAGNLIIADQYWNNRAIDLQVGDLVLVPMGSRIEARCLEPGKMLKIGQLFVGKSPGIGRFVNDKLNWAAYARVSRRAYIGRNKFRFLEEAEGD